MSRASLLAVSALLLSLAPACFPYREGVQANGGRGNLQFGGFTNEQTAAMGLRLDVDVARFDAQWNCAPFQKSLDPAETTSASVHPSSCAEDAEPISLVDAHCDDDACDVTSDEATGGVHLHVVGKREGATTLHVHVKSRNDGASWDDTYPLRFLAVTDLALERGAGEPWTRDQLAFPGALHTFCGRFVHTSATGEKTWLVASEEPEVTVQGDAVVRGASSSYGGRLGCFELQARAPGSATVLLRKLDVSHASTLAVADPARVASVELRGESAEKEDEHVTAETPMPLGGLVTSFEIDSYDETSATVVATLDDGRVALGGAGALRSAPADLLLLRTDVQDAPPLASSLLTLWAVSEANATGAIVGDIGPVHVEIPVRVTASTRMIDGGAGGAVDAGMTRHAR